MERSRLRVSMSVVCLAVCLVALNLRGVQLSGGAIQHGVIVIGGGYVDYAQLPPIYGFFLASNLVVIGIWFGVVRLFRSRSNGRPKSQRVQWVERQSYFSLQILAIVWLASRYMPSLLEGIEAFIPVAIRAAAQAWGATVGEPNGTVPWLILNFLLLSLLVSGPILFVSQLGLAGISLSMRSGSRWAQISTVLIELVLASAILGLCTIQNRFLEIAEDHFVFEIVDKSSGLPVTGARVCISNAFADYDEDRMPVASTGTDGRATISGRFLFSVRRSAFRHEAKIATWGQWLEIAAGGHPPLRIPLTELMPEFYTPSSINVVRVVLPENRTPETRLEKLAGMYWLEERREDGRALAIYPDGWFVVCDHDNVHAHEAQEFGRIDWRGDTLEFSPIPHEGRAFSPLVTHRYRPIRWGEHLFLAVEDDRVLQGFCALALTSDKSPDDQFFTHVWIKKSNPQQPPEGWPTLPLRVWPTYLRGRIPKWFKNKKPTSLR